MNGAYHSHFWILKATRPTLDFHKIIFLFSFENGKHEEVEQELVVLFARPGTKRQVHYYILGFFSFSKAYVLLQERERDKRLLRNETGRKRGQ